MSPQPDWLQQKAWRLPVWPLSSSWSSSLSASPPTEWQNKILTKPRPNLTKPKRTLFSETNFNETKTKTFFPNQIVLHRNRDFFPRPNFLKPKPKSSKNWQKSWDRDRNQDFWISLTIFGEIHNLRNCCLPSKTSGGKEDFFYFYWTGSTKALHPPL